MASDASKGFARLERGPAAHRLNDVAVRVEELEIDGRHRWNLKEGGTVLLDGRLAKNALRVPRAVPDSARSGDERVADLAEVPVPTDAEGAIEELDDAHLRDNAALNSLKAGPFVNVLNEILTGLLREVDLRRSRQGYVALNEGRRLIARDERIVRQKLMVAVEIEPVDAEGNFVAPLLRAFWKIRNEDIGVVERVRVRKERAVRP